MLKMFQIFSLRLNLEYFCHYEMFNSREMSELM